MMIKIARDAIASMWALSIRIYNDYITRMNDRIATVVIERYELSEDRSVVR